MIGNEIDQFIQNRVKELLEKGELPEIRDYIETDSIAEIIEKLIIVNIRAWMIEDMISTAKSDFELAELKRKLDICFKQKRPKFIEALNILVDNAIITGKSLREDSVKIYK